MCEESEGRLEEYLGEHHVYRVEDGERHWYVATSAGRALRAHESLMEPEDAEPFTVTRLAPAELVEVTLEDADDARAFPAAWYEAPDPEDEGARHVVRATAGSWALHLGEKLQAREDGEQIASSCF